MDYTVILFPKAVVNLEAIDCPVYRIKQSRSSQEGGAKSAQQDEETKSVSIQRSNSAGI